VLPNNIISLQTQPRYRFCGSANLVIQRRSTFQELTCQTCNRANQRVSNPIRLADKFRSSEPPAISAPDCRHCAALEQVLRELEGVNRELRVIVRALVNGAIAKTDEK
jgi:hypothetical protein